MNHDTPPPQYVAAGPGQYVPVPPQYVFVPARSGNGLAVFGFITALIGLFIPTGLIALLGLLISLVALSKPPRTLAVMGVMLGLIGTAAWLAIMVLGLLAAVVGAIGLMMGGAVMFAITQPHVIAVTSDMINIAMAAESHYHEQGELPGRIDELELDRSTTIDPWGTPYRLVLVGDSGRSMDVVSAGPDSVFDNDDDITLTNLDRVWEEAFETFGERMETWAERAERFDGRSFGGACSGIKVTRQHKAEVRLNPVHAPMSDLARRYESAAESSAVPSTSVSP